MTNDALINGKVHTLSDDEKKNAEKFHRARIPFIWINNHLTFNENTEDDRDHQHWICEDYGMTIEEFESLPRGYILPGRVQLFIGSSFAPIDIKKIDEKDLSKLIRMHNKQFPTHYCNIYNGVIVGKVGEVWPPMYTINVDRF